METLQTLKQIFNPDVLQNILVSWGWLAYPILGAIVFAETGLLVGFALPGDSLLFITGFVASMGHLNVWVLIVLLSTLAILGDTVGYHLGKKMGPKVFNKPDSLFFKQEHIQRTHDFYEKHGGKTIVLARFIPVLRTFAPFVAGVADMNYARFVTFNVFGGIGWVTSMILSGYFLGNLPIIKNNFEKAVLVIIFISVLPIFFHSLKANRVLKNARFSPFRADQKGSVPKPGANEPPERTLGVREEERE